MPSPQNIIIVPGLGDHKTLTAWATKRWPNYGLEPIIHCVGWYDSKITFLEKLQNLTNKIDELISQEKKVSLIGCSAGASAVMNAFIERKNVIHRAISICGRLKEGTGGGFRSLKSRSVSSPLFAESVRLFENRENLLSESDRKKIMTVRAMFGDELVPANTSILDGAQNIKIPIFEHSLSIYTSLWIFSKPLVNFLTKD